MSRRWTRPFAIVVGIGVLVFAAQPAPLLEPTEAAWLDRVSTRGAFGTGRWASTGSARADLLLASLDVTALLSGSTGLIGPARASLASPSAPGPNSKDAASVTIPNPSVVGVTATVVATVGRTFASYAPANAAAEASATGLGVGLDALSIPLLNNLVTLVRADGGAIAAATACRANGTTSATTTPLANLQVGLLGGAISPLNVVGNTGSASVVALTQSDLARVSVTIGVTRTATATSAPADPSATAQLTAVIDVAVEQRLLTILAFALSGTVTLRIPLVTANCTLDLP